MEGTDLVGDMYVLCSGVWMPGENEATMTADRNGVIGC